MKDSKYQEAIENDIQSFESNEYRNIILENVSKLKDKSREGFWKIKAKLFPKKQSQIPVAKKNIKGQLITNHSELKKKLS